jgi:hypothetical protein
VPISCLKIITNALAKKKKFVSPFSFTVKIIRIRCVQINSKNSNHLKKRNFIFKFFLGQNNSKIVSNYFDWSFNGAARATTNGGCGLF